MKKIVSYLGDPSFKTKYKDRLYYELGWSFVGQTSDFSFTLEVLDKIEWTELIKVRDNDSILLKSLRNWRITEISKFLLKKVLTSLKGKNAKDDFGEEVLENIIFHFKKCIEMVILYAKKIKMLDSNYELGYVASKSALTTNNNTSAEQEAVLSKSTSGINFLRAKKMSAKNLDVSTKVISVRKISHAEDNEDATVSVLDCQRNFYKTLLEEITKFNEEYWKMSLSQCQNPSKLFEIKKKVLTMLELEITYPYFERDENGKKYADQRKNYIRPALKIFRHEFKVMRKNPNTYLDLLWLEKDRFLVGTL